MVQVREITKAQMWSLYQEDVLYEVVFLGDRIVAHNVKNAGDTPEGYEIVWCPYP